MKQFLAPLAISLSVAACSPADTTAVSAAGPGTSSQETGSQIAAKIGSRAFSNADLDARLKADMEALKARAAASDHDRAISRLGYRGDGDRTGVDVGIVREHANRVRP